MSGYRGGTIKRERRNNDQLELLDAQILSVLDEDHPQSVRHIFYRMTDPRLREPVEKSDRGYRHVQDQCVKLRRSGRVPYSWIADMSRHGYFVNTFNGAGDFLRSMAGLYRANLWRDSEFRCEVWCESRSIASVLLVDCEELAVDLFPCGGFSSLSFVHAAAQQHNASSDVRPLVVLFVGDFDPAGVWVDVALERELREHLASRIDLHFERVAINLDQIEAYALPTKPRKAGNLRSPQVSFSVEAEAMRASDLRDIVRTRVEALLPEGSLAASLVAEQSERNHLLQMAALLPGDQP